VTLGIALPLYNAAIPGEVAFAAVEGRLLGAFTVRGLRLSDESGAALVTADAIAVAWAPARLLTGELEIEALVVERLQVRLPGEGGGFADLAPPGEDVPVDMSLPPGPNLPLGIDVTLQLRDAALFAADGRPLVEALELNAR